VLISIFQHPFSSIQMSGHRQERVRQRILELITLILEREVQDPRLMSVNVTHVELSGDLGYAKVFVSAPQDEGESEEMMHALERASRYFRRRIAENMDLRFAPEIHFQLDHSIEKGERFLRILDQVQEEERIKEVMEKSKPTNNRTTSKKRSDH
jgi:ribosome-binding factor A